MEDFGFKFKIGDWVTIAGTAVPAGRESKKWWYRDQGDRYIILGRLLDECYGGVQRHYRARAVNSGGGASREYITFAEPELEASQPFTADPPEPEPA